MRFQSCQLYHRRLISLGYSTSLSGIFNLSGGLPGDILVVCPESFLIQLFHNLSTKNYIGISEFRFRQLPTWLLSTFLYFGSSVFGFRSCLESLVWIFSWTNTFEKCQLKRRKINRLFSSINHNFIFREEYSQSYGSFFKS